MMTTEKMSNLNKLGYTNEQLAAMDNATYATVYVQAYKRSYAVEVLANAMLLQAQKGISLHHAANLCKYRLRKAIASGAKFADALQWQSEALAKQAYKHKSAYSRQLPSVSLDSAVVAGQEDQSFIEILDRMDFDACIEKMKKQEVQALAQYIRLQNLLDKQDVKKNETAANGKLKVTNLQKTHGRLAQKIKYLSNKYFASTSDQVVCASLRFGFLTTN